MEAKLIDKKTFRVSENDKLLGELTYENLFFLKAKLELPDLEVYDIAQVGFWGTSISVKKAGKEIANLVMTWSGKIVIRFHDGQEFVLKLNGLFSNKYIIENSTGQKIIELNAKFNWRDFHCNYDIAYNISNDKPQRNVLLILLSVYGANYFIATMSGANAGMM